MVHQTRYGTCAIVVQAEQKDERRRRGDAATQTSDARFDERFQMAHGLLGEAGRPWYVKPSLLSEAERWAQPLRR